MRLAAEIQMGCLELDVVDGSVGSLVEGGWHASRCLHSSSVDVLRTPDPFFDDLPDFPFAPNYVEIDAGGTSLRVHHLDEGPADGPVVLLLHGEPSWSYLYRTMIPPLVSAGFRCIAPDLVGFGRSDKPAEQADYSYERSVDWLDRHVIDALDLQDVTLVCQDWGGLLGLRIVARHPDRFARVVVANTGMPDGSTPMSDAFFAWQSFATTAEEFPVGAIVNAGSLSDLSNAVIAAYDAPFPDDSYKAAARVFPSLVPTRPDSPSAIENAEAWEILRHFERPWLCAFSDSDPITGGGDRIFLERIPGARSEHQVTIVGAGHFLQEDQGPQLAAAIIEFVGNS